MAVGGPNPGAGHLGFCDCWMDGWLGADVLAHGVGECYNGSVGLAILSVWGIANLNLEGMVETGIPRLIEPA